MNTLVLNSGGLDSTTVVALAIEKTRMNGGDVQTLSFNYGQRHTKELEAARMVADYYNIGHHVLDVTLPKAGSVLMEHDAEMPHATYEELAQSVGVSPTYVPFRNGTFLSHATAYALDRGADILMVGVHAEDARGWAYPDCTPEFIGAMANAIYVGTYHKVRLEAPLQYLMKFQIVAAGIKLNAPYHLTWSCYEGRTLACGKCPTCVGRLEAFSQNFAKDPIAYEEGIVTDPPDNVFAIGGDDE